MLNLWIFWYVVVFAATACFSITPNQNRTFCPTSKKYGDFHLWFITPTNFMPTQLQIQLIDKWIFFGPLNLTIQKVIWRPKNAEMHILYFGSLISLFELTVVLHPLPCIKTWRHLWTTLMHGHHSWQNSNKYNIRRHPGLESLSY